MSYRGLTLIELIVAVVVIGIMIAFALPPYQQLSAEAKEASCEAALAGVRAAIENYRSAMSEEDSATWPTLEQLNTVGLVIQQVIPDNPYSTGRVRNRVMIGKLSGVTVTDGTVGAWCYDESTGEFWPDTSSGAGEVKF